MPELLVVIPTTHWVEEVVRLEADVRRTSPVPVHVVVVDNGPAASLEAWPSHIDVVADPEYLGAEGAFGLGVSRAIDYEPRWTLLLDHDAEIDDGTIGDLLKAAESDPARVYVAGGSSIVWAQSTRWGPVYIQRPTSTELLPLDFGQWSGLLLPLPAAREVATFRSGFFFGWDDYRMIAHLRELGFTVRGVPWAIVVNRRQPGQFGSAWRRYYGARNRILLAAHLHGRWSVAVLRATLTEIRGLRHQPMARLHGIRDGLLGRTGMVVSP